ncbi:MAG: OmpA family protein [Burkholderiales bacterium]|nr:OmpA family protein [Bacteroidia bacterium]
MIKQSIILALLVTTVYAQEGAFIKANKFYESKAYSDAIPKYESVIKRDKENDDALRKLADCYRLNNNTAKCEETYEILALTGKANGQDIVYYTQALMSNGKYTKAKEVLAISGSITNDKRIRSYSKALDQLDTYFKDSSYVKIKKENGLNSEDNDFAPVPYKDGIIFSSNRARNQWISQKHDWTNKGFNYLYFSKQEPDKSFEKPQSLFKRISTKYNDGPVSFSSDNNVMYFTRNNIEEGKVLTSSDKTIKLKIFSSMINPDGIPAQEISFKYNSNEYNCAHPTISFDGNTLIFSSDMPGTIGGMDLWSCTKQKDGTWNQPFNLGGSINTAGSEVFPYLHNEGKLYYSSNGLDGLGGLDIYEAIEFDGDWIINRNLNAPINSSGDDLGLTMDKTGKTGYFSSNRNNKNGDDDIYSFINNKPKKQPYKIQVKDSLTNSLLTSTLNIRNMKTGEITNITETNGEYNVNLFPNAEYEFVASSNTTYVPKRTILKTQETIRNIDVLLAKPNKAIQGYVYDKETKQPLANTAITINDISLTTDVKGFYKSDLLGTHAPYKIGASKKDYLSNLDYITLNEVSDNGTTADIYLDRVVIGKAIKIDNIYFDLSKYNIRRDAALELNKIVNILKENPSIIIELGSHTDCRSSDAFNMKLSDNRAKSSAAYIVSQGIDKKRITGKGYGETKPVSNCACEGTKLPACNEEQHQANRRTEFKIIGFLK